jgi:hypothetical protein
MGYSEIIKFVKKLASSAPYQLKKGKAIPVTGHGNP